MSFSPLVEPIAETFAHNWEKLSNVAPIVRRDVFASMDFTEINKVNVLRVISVGK